MKRACMYIIVHMHERRQRLKHNIKCLPLSLATLRPSDRVSHWRLMEASHSGRLANKLSQCTSLSLQFGVSSMHSCAHFLDEFSADFSHIQRHEAFRNQPHTSSQVKCSYPWKHGIKSPNFRIFDWVLD